MSDVGAYKKQSLTAGWSRVDMLLQLYDKAIGSIQASETAHQNDDQPSLTRHTIESQKAILAIHAGLKPEEHEVAYNIARLLHFVATSLEEHDYAAAVKVLTELRNSYASVADEVNRMERNGEIPPMPMADEFRSMA